MSNFKESSYDVILNGKYYLREVLEDAIVQDSLDEIAARLSLTAVITNDLPSIFNGNPIELIGIPFGESKVKSLFNGVLWDISSESTGTKHATLDIFDRTKYIAESEDEYIFPAGQTATQRIKQYATDWGIPLGNVADIKIPLAKAIYRPQSIYNMIAADLRENVSKGGKMYQARMNGTKLDLIELGSNKTVWVLESLDSIIQKRSLSGTTTQVKIIGQVESEEQRSPVYAIKKKDTDTYGTIQKVIYAPKASDLSAAKQQADEMLQGIHESFFVRGIDINTIRAGDKVQLNGIELLVISAQHKLGVPGEMLLEVGSERYVRRNFYV